MAKAFVETTVLADLLLKKGEPAAAARAALRRYELTELPVYAIKELKAGILRNMVWFHNKLVSTRSFSKAIDALHRMSLTPRRYTTATALEALRDAAASVEKTTTGELVREYGSKAKLDAVLCDRFRLTIKLNIVRAWKRRRTEVTSIVYPLACFEENSPYEDGDLLMVDSTQCADAAHCSIAKFLTVNPAGLRRLKETVDAQPKKSENTNRAQALRALIRTPKRDFSERMCRALGDAVFAFLAPSDAAILTTNIRDLAPLAAALGKKVDSTRV